MKNITLSIDEDVLDRVRIVAAQRKTSVNALVREHLTRLAGHDDKLAEAMRELRELSEATRLPPGTTLSFSREDAYDDPK